MNKIIVSLGICAGMMILAACASPGSQAGGGDLTGKVWALTELAGKPPAAGVGISAEFGSDGRVSGSAGCNRYSGTYTVSGNSITISSPMATTMMMCDEAVMEQESAYLKALGEAEEPIQSRATSSTLTGPDKTQPGHLQSPSQDLSGTSWEVTRL